MALYAIGDLHLHFDSECRAPMQRTEPVWRNHTEQLRRACSRLISPEDTLVLVGDHSWGGKLSQCEKDLAYISALPGRKILTRGNHDRFWEVRQTTRLNERYAGSLFFLQNNYAVYGDYALIGSKGFCFEGPFYLNRKGRITGWDTEAEERSLVYIQRELERLRIAFELARADGFRKFILFLHYPPTNILQRRSEFTDLAELYGVHQVVYAHSHGQARFHNSIEGEFRCIEYSLVSGDYLNWQPKKILD